MTNIIADYITRRPAVNFYFIPFYVGLSFLGWSGISNIYFNLSFGWHIHMYFFIVVFGISNIFGKINWFN